MRPPPALGGRPRCRTSCSKSSDAPGAAGNALPLAQAPALNAPGDIGHASPKERDHKAVPGALGQDIIPNLSDTHLAPRTLALSGIREGKGEPPVGSPPSAAPLQQTRVGQQRSRARKLQPASLVCGAAPPSSTASCPSYCMRSSGSRRCPTASSMLASWAPSLLPGWAGQMRAPSCSQQRARLLSFLDWCTY